MRGCPPLPEGRSPSGRGGRAKTFSGSMALDSNPVAERREKAPCKPNVRTVDSAVSTRTATNFRRRPPSASTSLRCSTGFAGDRPARQAPFVLPPKSSDCNGCVECAGEPGVGALNVELARFERFYNACRPHQALGQTAPMQAYNENFKQSALAA